MEENRIEPISYFGKKRLPHMESMEWGQIPRKKITKKMKLFSTLTNNNLKIRDDSYVYVKGLFKIDNHSFDDLNNIKLNFSTSFENIPDNIIHRYKNDGIYPVGRIEDIEKEPEIYFDIPDPQYADNENYESVNLQQVYGDFTETGTLIDDNLSDIDELTVNDLLYVKHIEIERDEKDKNRKKEEEMFYADLYQDFRFILQSNEVKAKSRIDNLFNTINYKMSGNNPEIIKIPEISIMDVPIGGYFEFLGIDNNYYLDDLFDNELGYKDPIIHDVLNFCRDEEYEQEYFECIQNERNQNKINFITMSSDKDVWNMSNSNLMDIVDKYKISKKFRNEMKKLNKGKNNLRSTGIKCRLLGFFKSKTNQIPYFFYFNLNTLTHHRIAMVNCYNIFVDYYEPNENYQPDVGTIRPNKIRDIFQLCSNSQTDFPFHYRKDSTVNSFILLDNIRSRALLQKYIKKTDNISEQEILNNFKNFKDNYESHKLGIFKKRMIYKDEIFGMPYMTFRETYPTYLFHQLKIEDKVLSKIDFLFCLLPLFSFSQDIENVRPNKDIAVHTTNRIVMNTYLIKNENGFQWSLIPPYSYKDEKKWEIINYNKWLSNYQNELNNIHIDENDILYSRNLEIKKNEFKNNPINYLGLTSLYTTLKTFEALDSIYITIQKNNKDYITNLSNQYDLNAVTLAKAFNLNAKDKVITDFDITLNECDLIRYYIDDYLYKEKDDNKKLYLFSAFVRGYCINYF